MSVFDSALEIARDGNPGTQIVGTGATHGFNGVTERALFNGLAADPSPAQSMTLDNPLKLG